MRPAKHQDKTFFNTVVIALFVVAISAPSVKMIMTSPRETSKVERRTLVHNLELDGQSFDKSVAEFEAFFNDQVGFREQVVYWNNYMQAKVFDQSAVSDVIIGKDGWLYLSAGMDDYRGLMHFTEEELELWRRSLEAKRDWLASQGIEYLFVVAPDKQTVYPEYLPDGYTRVSESTLLDQLLAYLEKTSDLKILDLRGPLLKEKEHQQVYYRLDTHWDNAGAYVAYQAVMQELATHFPSEKALTLSELKIGEKDDPQDLAAMLGLAGKLGTEKYMSLAPAMPCATLELYPDQAGLNVFRTSCPSAQLNAIIFHDSFFGENNIGPLLGEHFHQAIYLNGLYIQPIMRQLIEEIQPQVVIEEVVERHFSVHVPVVDQKLAELVDRISSTNAFEQLPYQYVLKNTASDYADAVLRGITPTPAADGLLIHAADSDPMMIFSIPDVPPGSTIGVRVVLTTATANFLQVFYGGPGTPFAKDRSAMAELAPGKNEIYFTFKNAEEVNQMRVDPGTKPGEYTIHALEIRSSAPSPEAKPSQGETHQYMVKDATSSYEDAIFKGVTSTPTADGLLIHAIDNDPMMIFSIPTIPPESTIGVKVTLTTAETNSLQVFYSRTGVPFAEDRSVKAALVPGKNEVYLTFESAEAVDRIRIDPGTKPGDYTIHSLEIDGSALSSEAESLQGETHQYMVKDATSSYEDAIFKGVTSTPTADGLLIHAVDNDPIMIFSIPTIPPGSTVEVKVVLTTAETNFLQVFYSSPGVPFAEARSVKAALVPGRNEVYLTFESAEAVDRIRIDPGVKPGDYTIHALEIDGISPP